MTKYAVTVDLVTCIEEILNGKFYFCAEVALQSVFLWSDFQFHILLAPF